LEASEAKNASAGLIEKERAMPRGEKSAYTDKQKRKAEHIEESYESRGLSEKEAERRAWATVNKQDGGGKKSGSGKG
jgi:plasmid stabilization system protein ParE